MNLVRKHSYLIIATNAIAGFDEINLGYRTGCSGPHAEVGKDKKTAMQCAFDCRKEVVKKEGKTERDCEFVSHGHYCCSGNNKGTCYHEQDVTCDQDSMRQKKQKNYSLYKIERLRKCHKVRRVNHVNFV